MSRRPAALLFALLSLVNARAAEVIPPVVQAPSANGVIRIWGGAALSPVVARWQSSFQKNHPTAPQHRWLVVDGSIGSNSIEQARVFHQSFGLTGLVVTKLDGTSRGGALVGIYRQLRIPIYFLGLGEQPEDLQPFSVDHYAKAVFGLE